MCQLLLIGLLFASIAEAQDLQSLSLEELMEVKVKVATQTEKSLREAPGIITVIDENEIRSSGARNLLEILATVPGFSLGHDVLGNISLLTRGIWAQEGRILLLWDGHEMNDRSYGTIQLGDHFPADHIKRIEIIRGPGSVIYGGIAELGVINVITKKAEDLNGYAVSASHSRTSEGPSGNTLSVQLGQKSGDLSFSLKGMFRESNFSDQNYTDENGTTADLGNNNSRMKNEHLNLRLDWKNFYYKYLRDDYKTKNIVLWGDLENNPGSGIIRNPVPKEYPTTSQHFGWKGNLSDDWKLHTYVQNKNQLPYYQPDTTNEVAYANSWRRSVERRLLGTTLHYRPEEKSNLLFGAEFSDDKSRVQNRLNYSGSPDTFGNGSRQYRLSNTAFFGQYDLSTSIANITAGIRYDNPSITRDVFVPRLGITKVMGRHHIKALFAEAFRAPLIENISLNESIEPEITRTYELEYGFQFTPKTSLTTNLFSTSVQDIIVYSYDSVSAIENYTNYDLVKTWGAETELRWKGSLQDVRANYSFYAVDTAKAAPFETRLDQNGLLGAPRHKLFLSDAISLSEKLVLTPSLLYFVDTTSYDWSGGVFKERFMPNQLIGNIFIRRSDLMFNGFSVGAGVNNLFNSYVYYAQPYVKEGDYRAGPFPGRSRDYHLRLEYVKEF